MPELMDEKFCLDPINHNNKRPDNYPKPIVKITSNVNNF